MWRTVVNSVRRFNQRLEPPCWWWYMGSYKVTSGLIEIAWIIDWWLYAWCKCVDFIKVIITRSLSCLQFKIKEGNLQLVTLLMEASQLFSIHNSDYLHKKKGQSVICVVGSESNNKSVNKRNLFKTSFGFRNSHNKRFILSTSSEPEIWRRVKYLHKLWWTLWFNN